MQVLMDLAQPGPAKPAAKAKSPPRTRQKKSVDWKQFDLALNLEHIIGSSLADRISYFKNKKYKVSLAANDLPKQNPVQKSKEGENRQTRLKNLLQDISNRQRQMKVKMAHLKSTRQNQEEQQLQQCTFVPQIRHNPRYHIVSTMLDRNKSWQSVQLYRDEAKVKHFTSIKQELVQSEIQQCTFRPNLAAHSRSKQILRKRELRDHRAKEIDQQDQYFREQKNQNKHLQSQEQTSSKKNKREYEKIKQLIRKELSCFNIQF